MGIWASRYMSDKSKPNVTSKKNVAKEASSQSSGQKDTRNKKSDGADRRSKIKAQFEAPKADNHKHISYKDQIKAQNQHRQDENNYQPKPAQRQNTAVYKPTKYDRGFLFEDNIDAIHKNLKGQEKYSWVDNVEEPISSSSDPYATMISKLIDRSQPKSGKAKELTAEEFNNLSLDNALVKLRQGQIEVKGEEALQQLWKQSMKMLGEKDNYAKSMIKDSPLGKNKRFRNLMTDIVVNTFNPNAQDPHSCAKEFKMFAFLAYDGHKALEKNKYNLKLQNILTNELFSEPGHLSGVKSKFLKALIFNRPT